MRQGQVQGTEGRRAWRYAVPWQKTVLQVFSTEGASVVRKEPWNCRSPGVAECQSCHQPGMAGVCCDPGFLEKWVIFPCMWGCFTTSPLVLVPRDWSVSSFLSTACALKAHGERRDGKGKWQVCRVLNFLRAHPLISEAKEVCKCASGECWSWLVSTADSHAPC